MTTCRGLQPLLDPYMDGELQPDRMIEVEQHLANCSHCLTRVRLASAVRSSLREQTRNSAPVSPEFQVRVERALAAERERETARATEAPSHGYLPWQTILPMAAAAAATLVWAASIKDRPEGYSSAVAQPVTLGIADGADQLIDEFVSVHARGGDATMPAVAEPSLIGQLEPEVGFPVRAPSLSEYGASWEGGTVVRTNHREQRAALLRYRVGSHRVSVYIYDANRWPLRAHLEPRVVRNMPVYVGQRRGYSIAAAERRGIGYAAAADLDDEETAELVAAAYR
ncbi:MAG: zf-HC2 domain-containing protein [Polyangiaceae bacterium]|nr:zf-HC2 domain-containing protein [Polyangiaceae bacterium]